MPTQFTKVVTQVADLEEVNADDHFEAAIENITEFSGCELHLVMDDPPAGIRRAAPAPEASEIDAEDRSFCAP